MQNVCVFQSLQWIVCGHSGHVRYISIWISSCWHLRVSTEIIIRHSILFEVYGRMVHIENMVLLRYGCWKIFVGECV